MTDFATTDVPTLSDTDGVALFYVQPRELVKIEQGKSKFVFLICDYYDDKGKPIDSRTMESAEYFFRVMQDPSRNFAPTPPNPEVQKLRLVNAVAKTLKSTCNLNDTFVANPDARGRLSVVMPVLPGTTRGVILVFRSPGDASQTEYLVATSDPEIKNGSSSATG